MRKIILCYLLTIIACNIQAQISKNSLLLGGDFSLNLMKSDNNMNRVTSNTFIISPVLGVAVKENLFLGGSLSYGSGKNVQQISPTTGPNWKSYGAGMFLRKYKMVVNKFYLFLQGDLSFNYFKTHIYEAADYSYDQKNNTIRVAARPGISYQLTRNLFLESGLTDLVSISYNWEKRTIYNFGNVTNQKTTSFNINSSLNNFNSNLYFGFRLMLNKKS